MSYVTTEIKGDLNAFLLKARNHFIKCVKEALANLCQECDERARNNDGGWRNYTGNLRSSIGGAAAENGRVYFTTEFATILNGSEGSAKGRSLVQSLASQYVDAVVMVMVAAMDYAEKVEAVDSKDVLESTRIYAESVVKSRLEEAKAKAEKEINSWTL